MRLISAQLRDFRNYQNLVIDFPSRLTFLVGQNASGKTNLLESIGLLAHGRSFRGSSDADLTREGTNGYYIRAKYEKTGTRNEIEMAVDFSSGEMRRRIKLNEKPVTARSAIVGQFMCVVFSPADLQIVEGGPGERRKFIDATISSMDAVYLQNLIQYQKALRQRNALLKRIRERKNSPQDLAIWNTRLAHFAELIWKAREDFLERFHGAFTQALGQISGDRDKITYSIHANHRNDLMSYLESSTMKDTRVGYTTAGPHRDSPQFEREGKDILQFGSQGQRRSIALGLRIAQFHYLKASTGVTPVLLIDDVIRELDALRRSAFVKLLEESGQAIFTTPDLDGLDDNMHSLLKQSVIYSVSPGGNVERREGKNV
ncbi:MAG: DNA replication/repair protein RecF [Leptospirales bacterium]|nr:DNA replication/repair protein RecF [Leptospirales bacterium]